MTPFSLRIGIDIGGTFTDFVVLNNDTGEIETFKLPSTPDDPARAVLIGLKRILQKTGLEHSSLYLVHGSTVATNALIERRGARTALVTTRGFRDVIQIGRQNRPALYDFFADPPEALVPDELRYEISERVDCQGNVIVPLIDSQITELTRQLSQNDIESVAVCLIFSFLHPEHEQIIGKRMIQAGFFTSLSSEVLPEYREYERASTTVINAYVSPILNRYLSRLKAEVSSIAPDTHLLVMQSNGGSISIEEARKWGVRCVLSGPAGGVIGGVHLARLAASRVSTDDKLNIITFDMGGTSTDVCLVNERPNVTTETRVAGYPIGIPMLDIHTIGAGGGSIAYADPGGALRVGPESAGAFPGPACYGVSDLPTVTDANLVLGRLLADLFLGGQIRLDGNRAFRAIQRLGGQLGINAIQTALGIVEVANTHMERALRLISVEQGHDPADYLLFTFGGAGGLHASDLARRLGIPRLLISPLASTLSAFGMLVSHLVKDYSQTVMLPGDSPIELLDTVLSRWVERGLYEIINQGIPQENILIERMVDMRYQGQSYELTIPLGDHLQEDFHTAHHHRYGFHRQDASIEIVNVRVRATGLLPTPVLRPAPFVGKDASRALIAVRPVRLAHGEEDIPVYRGEKLLPGNYIKGPALIVRADTTALIESGDECQVDEFGNLCIQIGIR